MVAMLAMMTMAGTLSDHYGWLGMAGYAATGFPKVTRPTIVWWTHHHIKNHVWCTACTLYCHQTID